MIVRVTPGALAAWGGFVAAIGAVGGVWLNAWKTRKDVRIAEEHLDIERQDSITKQFDTLFKNYIEHIQGLEREVSKIPELERKVADMQLQLDSLNSDKIMAELRAEENASQAFQMKLLWEGEKTLRQEAESALADCSKQKAALLAQLTERAGSPNVQAIDRAASDSDP